MSLSRLLAIALLSLSLTPKTWCATEQKALDPNDAKFEALTRKSFMGRMSDSFGKSRTMGAWNDYLKTTEKYKDAPLAPEYQQI